MRKFLLSAIALIVVNFAFSQVVLKVISPSDISGSLTHVYVDSAQVGSNSPWNNVPDMDSVYNAFIDTVALAYDDGNTIGTGGIPAGDSACCGTIVTDLTGKIALIYRGGCEFGTKAYKAQQAGAIGCIIVNTGGAPISMGAGTTGDGNLVTIPVTMIGVSDGNMIQNAILNGDDVVMYFGTEYGYYGDDLGMPKERALVARASSIPSALAMDDTEFDVPLGCWVYNYGSNDQVGATVTARVDFNSTNIYEETSVAFDVASKDSAYVSFTTFSQSSYPNGQYLLSYALDYPAADQAPENDSLSYIFTINDEYFSYTPLDVNTGEPLKMTPLSIPGPDVNTFIQSTSCIVFADSNASRVAVRGLTFSAGSYDPLEETTLEGEYLEFVAYEWNDVFEDIDDANIGFTNLAEISTTDFNYDTDDQNEIKTADFERGIALEDNQRYLFCMTSYYEHILFGFDNSVSYEENQEQYKQPMTPINNGDTWYLGYGGSEPTLSLRVLDGAAAGVQENEVEVTPYPNPANDIITIPLSGFDGEAQLMVTDMTGKIMMSRSISLSESNNLRVNVSDLPSGYYTFKINFDNGNVSRFNVAVTK